jgi:LuxR family transcriptional regulator, maltose regulon positive regulatory protein
MANRARVPAKVSPPKLSGILARKRLFNLLDEGREKPVIWVSGQPGAGKTALVASYLETKKLAHAWFHVDAGDADPASFFHFLRGIAARQSRSKRLDSLLPLLTPEYLPDLVGFSRRWFRQFFDLLPPKFVLVFDNYQDAGQDAPLHSLLRDAADELPGNLNIVVISRIEPPAEFARLAANRKMATVDWSDLQLTLEETAKIVDEDLTLDEPTIKALQDETQGWAAGVTLMLERIRRTGKVNRIDRGDSMETVFNYFADLIFKQASDSDQHALLRLSLLPAMTAAQACELTENAEAGKLLETLFRRRMFTDRRAGPEFTYNFHPLYRAFLRNRAESALGQETLRQTKCKAATILEQLGQREDAFALFVSAADWESSVRCLLNHALPLIQQGRWQTLESWFAALPESVRNSSPWLTYWRGVCRLAIDPSYSRTLFEQAYEDFLTANDTIGKALAASGAASSIFYEYINFEQADKWIPIIEKQIVEHKNWPTLEIEFQILSSFLILLIYHQPRHSLLPACMARLSALLNENIDLGLKVITAAFMLHLSSWWGDNVLGQRLVNIVQPIISSSSVAPLYLAWWKIALSCNGTLCGSPNRALEAAREALAIIEQNNLVVVRDKILLYYFYATMVNEVPNLRHKLAQELEMMIGPSHPVQQTMFHLLKSWQALLNENASSALSNAEAAISLCEHIGVPNFHLHALIGKAIILNEMRDHQSAIDCLRQVDESAVGTKSALFDFTILLIEADATFGLGDTDKADKLLADAFDVGSRFDQMGTAQWIAPMMSRLCGRALNAGIQPEYISRLIRHRKLVAPSHEMESWPWPTKLSTLGRFELSINGTAYAPSRKAQRKVLDLLKVLIALGGRDVSSSQIIETLWPDLDGDAAQNNLKASIHRLRKLLGSDSALIVHEAKVSIDWTQTWCDVASVEALADRILEASFERASLPQAVNDAQRLMSQYRGHFLPEESEISCVLVTRDRLRNKFRRAVLRIGRLLETNEAYSESIDLYQRAIDLDNLSEDIYQRLIFCLKKRGQDAEALNVFRRCREMLSIVLGVAPSRETQALVNVNN